MIHKQEADRVTNWQWLGLLKPERSFTSGICLFAMPYLLKPPKTFYQLVVMLSNVYSNVKAYRDF